VSRFQAESRWLKDRRLVVLALILGTSAGIGAAEPPPAAGYAGRTPTSGVSFTSPRVERVLESSEAEFTLLRTRFPSGRDQVAVDVYRPTAEGPHPVVVLLHGAQALRSTRYYSDLATDLARRGFTTLAVQYYERGRRGRGSRADWRRSVSDAVTFAESVDGADPGRVGVLGFSLGAFLALEQAPRDPRVRAAVAFYGGLSSWRVQGVESEMPPTLLLHGSADRIVPVWRSVEAAEFLRTAGCEADVLVYPRVHHGFGLNSRGGIDRAAARDAWERAVAFLECHLRSPTEEAGESCPNWVEGEGAAVRALLNPSRDEVRRAALSSGPRTAGG